MKGDLVVDSKGPEANTQPCMLIYLIDPSMLKELTSGPMILLTMTSDLKSKVLFRNI